MCMFNEKVSNKEKLEKLIFSVPKILYHGLKIQGRG